MKPGIRKSLMLLLLGIWVVATAQAPPGQEPAATVEAAEQAPPCVDVTDRQQVPAGQTVPLDGARGDTGQAAVPCEKQPSAETLGETSAGPEAIVEEDPGIEVSAEEVFTPGEEISEDYPVPLPSDI